MANQQKSEMDTSEGLRQRFGGFAGSFAGPIDMETVRGMAKAGRTVMVLRGVAYDFTDFAKDHPGGADYLLQNKGKVATDNFEASHPLDIIERTLTKEQLVTMRLGPIDSSTLRESDAAVVAPSHNVPGMAHALGTKPSLDSCLNIYDFEAIASGSITDTAWAYYSSGADDEITLRENNTAFNRVWMKPRVMVNVKDIDMRTRILGHESSCPVMLAAVAMCKLGHPEGEVAWNRAAEAGGVIYQIPTLSSCALEDITSSATPGYPMFFQLYVNQDKQKVTDLVQKAESLGCSALFITVDAPQLGNREKDRRVKVTHSGANVQGGSAVKKREGTSKALTTFIDPSLSWDDLPFFKSITKMKIVLKGVATAEDTILALEQGCAGVVLSNHGGRQLDYARSGLEILPEVMAALRAHEKYDPATFEVYIDGGVRRGTDVFKALALGAKAVAVGRPALYAMCAHGQAGVEKMIEILKSELAMTMRLMGTPTLGHIRPEMVSTEQLSMHVAPVPTSHLAMDTYIPALTQAMANSFGRYAQTQLAQLAAAPKEETKKEATSATAATAEPSVVWLTLQACASSVARSIFSLDPRTALARTAIFLMLYLVLHLGTNVFIFAFPDTARPVYNSGRAFPLMKLFEAYLLAAFVLHALAGLWLTYKFKKLHAPASSVSAFWVRARLAITGIVVLVFVPLHLYHFRFRPSAEAESRDLYREAVALFHDVRMVFVYLASLAAIGVHLWYGWEKAVAKFQLKGLSQAAVRLGQQALVPVMLGFALLVLWAHMSA